MLTRTLALLLICSILTGISCESAPEEIEIPEERVVLGAEIFIERHLEELEGQRIGLVMNPTARIGRVHMLDLLLESNVNITALFAPEHGFRGEAGAGERIEDGIDRDSGLPVFSLYGDTRQPTPEMLEHVDILIFDMQDVGARFYTYIATLGLVIESAAAAGIPVWVLDRPNPAGGNYVSGWIMEQEFKSFVGPYPIPIAHGLTMGEIAKMMVGERWINFEKEPDVRVVPMEGWNRDMKWPDTGLRWVAPSPNLPTFEHAYFYLGTVFYEGTTLSEGRGTIDPFLLMGDPSTTLSDEDIERLQNISSSIRIEPTQFTPMSIPGVAPTPKHEGEVCYGVYLSAIDYEFDPVRAGLEIFSIIMRATKTYELRPFRYRLAGTRDIDRLIRGQIHAADIDFGLEGYLEQRKAYL
ncbi:MAG: DUF1343 domain-containing protein, partial [Balneolaceae bacterium]